MNDAGVSAPVSTLAPELTDDLRAELIDCWVAVTNAGGAVGLLPPTTVAAARSLAAPMFARVASDGPDDLLVTYDDGRLVGWAVLASRGTPLTRHWRTIGRLQVRPELQGRGLGIALVEAAVRHGREQLGLDALHLTVRDGTGLDRFYERLGFVQVGRLPGSLRLGPGDYRDELYYVRALT